MSKASFSFPLCLLHYSKINIEKIIFYCLVEYGKLIYEKTDAEVKGRNVIEGIAQDLTQNEYPHCNDDNYEDFDSRVRDFETKINDYDEGTLEHVYILLAIDRLKFEIDSFERVLGVHDYLSECVLAFESKYGNDSYVQISYEIINDVLNKNLDIEIFKVLCSISAVLGRESAYKPITRERIYCGMNGFKSKDAQCTENVGFDNYFTDKHYEQKTNVKISRLVKRAKSKSLIKGLFTYKRRTTYYSTRITDIELMESVYKKKYETVNKSIEFEKRRTELQKELTRREKHRNGFRRSNDKELV